MTARGHEEEEMVAGRQSGYLKLLGRWNFSNTWPINKAPSFLFVVAAKQKLKKGKTKKVKLKTVENAADVIMLGCWVCSIECDEYSKLSDREKVLPTCNWEVREAHDADDV